MNDQLEFYTELMRKFNQDMERYLREELGCRQLINAGNWRTVDPVLVCDAERYSYTANEVIGKRLGSLISNLQRCRIARAGVISADVSRMAGIAAGRVDLLVARG